MMEMTGVKVSKRKIKAAIFIAYKEYIYWPL